MLISDLINKLEELKLRYGDVYVEIPLSDPYENVETKYTDISCVDIYKDKDFYGIDSWGVRLS